jgi:O-antigen/teichoic acid export membrane protein
LTARWRTLAGLAGATALSQGGVVAASPILTRLYTPSDFGTYAAALSIVAVATSIACFRYDQAIPLPRDPLAVASLLVLCCVLALLTTALVAILLVVAGEAIATVVRVGTLGALVPPILLAVLGGALYTTISAWAIRIAAFRDLAKTRVTQAVGLVVLQVSFGLIGAGAPGLVFGDAAGRSGGTTRLARLLWRTEAEAIRRVSIASMRGAAIRYKRFALLSTPSALLDIVAIQAPIFILLSLFGTTIAGFFLLASRVATVPNALAAASIGPVYLAEAARQSREDPSLLRASFRDGVRRLALLGIGPSLLLVVTSPILFPFVFGPNWANAGLYAAILAPMYYLQLVTGPISGILVVLERQDLHLVREVGSVAVLVVALAVVVAAQLEPLHAVLVLSVAGSINALTYLGVMWLAVRRIASRSSGDGLT